MVVKTYSSLSFSKVQTSTTPPHAYSDTSKASFNDQAMRLAQFAYVRAEANGAQGYEPASPEQRHVIETVASALERAFRDNSFACLSHECQEIAAARLTRQCLSGMRMVQALQGAMMNPATMAFQLKSNAISPDSDYNVFDHIMTAHKPSNRIRQATSYGAEPLALAS